MNGAQNREIQAHKGKKTLPVLVVIVLLFGGLIFVSISSQATDYTFGSENQNKGYLIDGSNKDAEDGVYAQLIEGDMTSDDNETVGTETVTTGSVGGSMADLESDDDSYRTLSEALVGSPDAVYYIFPSGDDLANWDTVVPSGSHYATVDETTEGGDGSSSYVSTGSNGDYDRFAMQDIPSLDDGYTIDLQVFAVHQKDSSQPCDFRAGIYIGSTYYEGYSLNPSNGVWTNTSSTVWMENPGTSAEWTEAEVNALISYIYTSDATPTVYCTQIGLKVQVNYSSSYQLEIEHQFDTVAESTSGYELIMQAKTGDAENLKVQVYDYTATTWNDRVTITSSSDEWGNYTLTADEYSSTLDQVKIKYIGGTESGDSTQTTFSIDVCLLRLKNITYELDIDMTATSLPAGEYELRVKGYTTTEAFPVDLWNYSSSAYDTAKITVTALSNTLYTYDLLEDHHISSQQCKIRFRDTTSADTTQDTLYLDAVLLRSLNAPPTISQYGHNPPDVNVGETIHFWCTYTDADNDAPSYVRVVINSVNYAMSKNGTDDDYTDGCAYYLDKSDLARDSYSYYYAVNDGNNPEVTTGSANFKVNGKPTLSNMGHSPETGNNGDTFDFWCIYTDADNDAPSYVKVNIASTDYDMLENDSGDTTYSDGKAYYYQKVLNGGTHDYYFKCADWLSGNVQSSTEQVSVNNKPTLSGFDRQPGDPVYRNTQLTFSVTFTDADGDLPTAIKWREDGGSTQNVSMSETTPADTDTTDGKDYEVLLYLEHGSHNYDFYASDGQGHVTGGSNSVTIQNRDPIIGNTPGSTTTYRSTAWSWDVDATDPDDDTVTYDEWNNCTFELTINPSTGLLSGTTDTNLGWYEVWVWANDSYGGSDSYNFQLSVVNRAPIISSEGNTTQNLDTFMCYEILASDPDNDELNYALSTNASFLSIENNWVNGTTTPVGTYWIYVWANDSHGGTDVQDWTLTVSALDDSTHTWVATSNSNANLASNWFPAQVPSPGDNIIFDSSSTYDCVWDLTGAYGNFTIDTGYTGTVTITVNFEFSNLTLLDGTLNGGGRVIVCNGDFEGGNGTFVSAGSTLVMNASGGYIRSISNLDYLCINASPIRIIIFGATIGNLSIQIDCSAVLERNITLSNRGWINGSLLQQGYRLNISTVNIYCLDVNGSFDGEIYLQTGTIFRVNLTANGSGWVGFERQTTFRCGVDLTINPWENAVLFQLNSYYPSAQPGESLLSWAMAMENYNTIITYSLFPLSPDQRYQIIRANYIILNTYPNANGSIQFSSKGSGLFSVYPVLDSGSVDSGGLLPVMQDMERFFQFNAGIILILMGTMGAIMMERKKKRWLRNILVIEIGLGIVILLCGLSYLWSL